MIGTTSVAVGETPAHEDPFKPDTEQYTYTFDHWEPEPVPAAADAAYTAVFTKTRLFTITWKNDDGSVIDTTKAAEGKTPAHADPSKPDTEQYLYTFERWDPEPVPADGDATYTAVFKETERKPNLLPVYFSQVRQDGTPGAPDDIKEQTWNLSFTLSLNGNSYASVKADPLKILPGGNHQSILVTFGNDLDVSQLNSDYKVDVKGVPSGVSADIYSADGGPVKQYTVSAGDPRFGNETETNAVRLTILVQWGWKEVSVKGPEPEVIRVVALPEDEIGAYQLRADGTKEYLIFQTYDICMAYLGRDELCRGPERCYHK